MTAIDVSIPAAGTSLGGTLLLPDGAERAPAALLITGSGPLDRDSNSKRIRVDVMRQIAEHLATVGVASLRYDKRGVGASGGDYHAIGFYDNVDDARSGLRVLRGRREVDPDRVFVVGHSEGALIAAELAGDEALAGVVLLAGAASTGEDILVWQARQVAGMLPAPVRWVMKVLRQDVAKTQAKRLGRIKASTTDVMRIGFAKLNAKWFREFIAHDPAVSLRRARVPVLAITGSKDIQVNPDDVAVMERLVPTPFTGEVPDNVTHLLRAQDGPTSLRGYKKQVRRPVDRGLLNMVTGWMAGYIAGEREALQLPT